MTGCHHGWVGGRKRIKLKKWSGKVTCESQALSLENGVLSSRNEAPATLPRR